MIGPRLRGRLRRAAHPLYRRLETRVHPLRYLFLEITQRCNLSCLHCGSDCGQDARLEELTTAEWIDFLDRLAARRRSPSPFLVLTGGEPFCRPELDALLARLQHHRFRWSMVTNGWALTEANLRRVRGYGLESLTVSLDGEPAAHDWLRAAAGAHARAVAGIERAVQIGVPVLDVVTCVHPRNFDDLPATLARLHRLGVRRWRIFCIFPKGRARENPALLLSPAQHRALLAWIAATRESLADTGFRLDFSCEGYLPPDVDAAVRDEPYFCRAGVAIGSVLCDGAISACPNIARELTQGNIRHDDFFDVWDRRFGRFRDRAWMRTGACTTCARWRRCQGNSMHLWDERTGETAFCHHAVLTGEDR